jgi:predicted amidohydrolase YtcJ
MNGKESDRADLIVRNARVTTLQSGHPAAQALASRGEFVVAVGSDADVMQLRGSATRVVDAGGRRVVPGLNDSHLHAIRAGVQYNLDLRWDGVQSLQRGLQMLQDQACRTPSGHWVRVMGGWSPFQFSERRMPTIMELNAAAPGTPALILFAYSEVLLNEAGVTALRLTSESIPSDGGAYDFADGGARIHGTSAVYHTIGRLPGFSDSRDQLNSTQYFLRELNRFGITSTVDAGASGTPYPEAYQAIATLAARPQFPIRISNFLFAQQPETELESLKKWTAEEKRAINRASSRLNGYVLEGAGEILVWSASDYENFMAPRPELTSDTLQSLAQATRLIAEHQWPIRIHATYDETISHILDVFEAVFYETGYGARWAIDHAETISARSISRIKAMGGGIAVQNRLAFAGEFFAERYGEEAAAAAQPLRQIVDAGIPVGAGTDATRVSSYNPWLSLQWMVTGRTVGGTQLLSSKNLLSREEALRLYTIGSAWFSREEDLKGKIVPHQYADFAILSADYMSVSEQQIGTIESVLTVTGGDIVYAAEPFESIGPAPLPAVSPAWSPVAQFGGYQQMSYLRTAGPSFVSYDPKDSSL